MYMTKRLAHEKLGIIIVLHNYSSTIHSPEVTMLPKMIFAVLTIASISHATAEDFKKGPVISDFGPHAKVEHQSKLSDTTQFKVAFDLVKQAEPGQINRKIESLARFINMHAADGVPKENIQLALVIHGKAVWDVTKADAYQAKHHHPNANLILLEKLIENGVQIMICGQSAAYYNITPALLANGVNMSLSAMTEHALLQQQGYTLNPF
ncbi:MAG: DsrE family protein [Aestuariibacter sp.]